MKKQILTVLAVLIAITIHAQDIPEVFKVQLGNVVTSSTALTKSLVASNTQNSQRNAQLIKTKLGEVEMKLLKGQTHMDWMKSLKELNESLAIIAVSDDINEQRQAFSKFNETLYSNLKTLGVSDISTLYYQYCPMALNNAGAYWFSDSKEILNPYFGQMMLKCGTTKEVIE